MITISESESKRRWISKPKLLGFSLILLIGLGAFYLGHVLASPSPSIGQVVTPGVIGPCDYFISMDGTTPVAHFESNRGGTPGDNLVGTAGQDVGAFLNSITQSGLDFCFGGYTFPFGTTWILQTGDNVEGVFNKTLFQPTVNSIDIIGITHPSIGGAKATNLLITRLSFSTNGHTGINGINFNVSISENANNDDVGFLQFYGTFNYIAIMDGNEGSILHDVYIGTSTGNGAGEISFKVAGGAAEIDNVQYSGAGGQSSAVHVLGQQFEISRSTLNQVIFERQTFSYGGGGSTTSQFTMGEFTMSSSYMANGDPAGISRFTVATGQLLSILSMTLKNNYIGLGNGGALFASLGTGSSFGINQLNIVGNWFGNLGGSALWFTKGGTSGTATLGQMHWDPSNYVSGTITSTADLLTDGTCSSFQFLPEPRGWGAGENWPALPVGIGSGNARQNCAPWPDIVYMNITSSAGVILATGIHVIDFASNTDKTLQTSSIYSLILYPRDKVYFATAIPYSWWWYGTEW